MSIYRHELIKGSYEYRQNAEKIPSEKSINDKNPIIYPKQPIKQKNTFQLASKTSNDSGTLHNEIV